MRSEIITTILYYYNISMIFEYSNFYSPEQNLRIIHLDELMYLGGETLLKPHKLDFYALLFVREGTLILNINYQKLEIKKGEAFFAGPGQFHSFTEFSDVKCIVVSFTEEFLLNNVKEDAVIENFKLLLNFSHVKN